MIYNSPLKISPKMKQFWSEKITNPTFEDVLEDNGKISLQNKVNVIANKQKELRKKLKTVVSDPMYDGSRILEQMALNEDVNELISDLKEEHENTEISKKAVIMKRVKEIESETNKMCSLDDFEKIVVETEQTFRNAPKNEFGEHLDSSEPKVRRIVTHKDVKPVGSFNRVDILSQPIESFVKDCIKYLGAKYESSSSNNLLDTNGNKMFIVYNNSPFRLEKDSNGKKSMKWIPLSKEELKVWQDQIDQAKSKEIQIDEIEIDGTTYSK